MCFKVNEHDKMLHQKADSTENVLKMFFNCQPNHVAKLASTSTGITLRPPLPGPSQTRSSGIFNATRTTSRLPSPGPTSSHESVSLHRPPVNVPYPTPKIGEVLRVPRSIKESKWSTITTRRPSYRWHDPTQIYHGRYISIKKEQCIFSC